MSGVQDMAFITLYFPLRDNPQYVQIVDMMLKWLKRILQRLGVCTTPHFGFDANELLGLEKLDNLCVRITQHAWASPLTPIDSMAIIKRNTEKRTSRSRALDRLTRADNLPSVSTGSLLRYPVPDRSARRHYRWRSGGQTLFVAGDAALKWFIVYDLSDADRDTGVADLNRMISGGAFTTTIAVRFPFDEIVAVHEMA